MVAEDVKEDKSIHAVFENFRKKESNVPPKGLIGDSGIPEPDEEAYSTNFQTNTSVQKVADVVVGDSNVAMTEEKQNKSNQQCLNGVREETIAEEPSIESKVETIVVPKLEECIADKSEVTNEGLRKGVLLSDLTVVQEERPEDFGDIKSTDSQVIDVVPSKVQGEAEAIEDPKVLVERLQRQVEELKRDLEARDKEIKRLKEKYEPEEGKQAEKIELSLDRTLEEAPAQMKTESPHE